MPKLSTFKSFGMMFVSTASERIKKNSFTIHMSGSNGKSECKLNETENWESPSLWGQNHLNMWRIQQENLMSVATLQGRSWLINKTCMLCILHQHILQKGPGLCKSTWD